MTDQNDEWTLLQEAWRTRADAAGESDCIRTRLAREKTRMYLEMGSEAAVSLACAGIFLWWSLGAEGAERAVLTGLSILAVLMLTVTTALRWRLWLAQADTMASFRTFMFRRAKLGLAFSRMGYVGGPLGVALGLVLGRHFGVQPSGAELSGSSTALALLALAAACWWSMRQARKWRLVLVQLRAARDEQVAGDA